MSRRERREKEEREAKEKKKREREERKKNKKIVKRNKNNDSDIDSEIKNGNIILRIIKSILKFVLTIIIIIVLVLGCFVGWLGFKYNWNLKRMIKGGAKEVALMMTGQTEEDVANLDPIYCLIMGVSTDEGLLLTDTLIVCAYYPRTQQASMMSIPRDTFVGKSEATATGGDKINAVYANYEGGTRGAEKLLETVEKLTGLEIDNYLVVKNEGLIEIVDEIGGVEFNVPINMDYDDWSQDLHIHLKAGKQKLNGQQAEQLLRFRHNNDYSTYSNEYGGEDIGRSKTQRAFITETIKQVLQLKNISKINDLIEISFRNTETNMDMDYVMKYSPAAVEFDINALQDSYLPGTPVELGTQKLSFYKPNKTKIKELIDDMFTFKEKESEATADDGIALEPEYIKLQVYDGTGNKEVFEDTIKRLEEKGYNIKYTGTTTINATTKVINRSGIKVDTIDELIDCLGYGDEINGKTSSEYDVTIIVGQDMNQYIIE